MPGTFRNFRLELKAACKYARESGRVRTRPHILTPGASKYECRAHAASTFGNIPADFLVLGIFPDERLLDAVLFCVPLPRLCIRTAGQARPAGCPTLAQLQYVWGRGSLVLTQGQYRRNVGAPVPLLSPVLRSWFQFAPFIFNIRVITGLNAPAINNDSDDDS